MLDIDYRQKTLDYIDKLVGGGLLIKGIYEQSKSEQFMKGKDRFIEGREISNTVLASGNQAGVVLKRYENYITWKDKKGNFNTECNSASLPNGVSLTIPTGNTPKVVVKNGNK